MTDTELLPCPFCGARAKIGRETLDERFAYADKVTVFCTKCSTSKSALGDTSKLGYADNSTVEARALEQWNSRVALASRPAEVDDELRAFASNLAKSQVAIDPEIASLVSENISELYASDDEVDDEGLPPLPKCVAYGFVGLGGLVPGDPHKQLIGVSVQSSGTGMQQSQVMLYTAEQYRQGQRDAVAADRAKVPVNVLLEEIRSAIDTLAQTELENRYYVPIVNTLHHCRDALKGAGYYGGYRAAPSHTTNKENG